MTLDDTLLEVGPVFNGRSFPLASMQEVTTARLFADEINSGRLNIKDAYNNFWTYPAYERLVMFYTLDQKTYDLNLAKDDMKPFLHSWRPLLTRLAYFLKEDKFEELLSTLMHNYLRAQQAVKDVLASLEPYKYLEDDSAKRRFLNTSTSTPFDWDSLFVMELAREKPLAKENVGMDIVDRLRDLVVDNDSDGAERMLRFLNYLKYPHPILDGLDYKFDYDGGGDIYMLAECTLSGMVLMTEGEQFYGAVSPHNSYVPVGTKQLYYSEPGKIIVFPYRQGWQEMLGHKDPSKKSCKKQKI